MPKIIKNGKEYSGVPREVVTAWQPTGDPVKVKLPVMGNTDISGIGDGTITGAISNINSDLSAQTFNVTTVDGLQVTNQSSHYITRKVVHIFARVKVNTVPTGTDIALVSFPSGMISSKTGMVVPLFKSNGEWNTPTTPIYSFIATNTIVVHSADLSVGQFVTVDVIFKIN